MDYFDLLVRKIGINVVCVAYRGYSKSKGKPNEKGIQMDARAIARWVRDNKQIDKRRLFLVGRSLGGAVAIHLLAE